MGFCGDVLESIEDKVGCTTTGGSGAMLGGSGMAELDNCEAGMEKSRGTELNVSWTFDVGGGAGPGIKLDANGTFGGTGVVALETGGGGGGTLGRVNDLHRLTFLLLTISLEDLLCVEKEFDVAEEVADVEEKLLEKLEKAESFVTLPLLDEDSLM